MRDEFESRMWIEHGAEFNAFVARVLDQAWQALKRLNEIEFDAPWLRPARPER